MKNLYSIVCSLSFGAVMATAGVSPGLLNLVMPDATVVSGMNVTQSITSPFGLYILSQMQGTDPGFMQFVTATGFDPRKDLLEVLAATPSTSSSTSHSGLILGRGVFQPAMIIGAATEQGGTVTNYRGFSLIGHTGDSFALAFLDGATAAMGDVPSVKSVIDRKLSSSTFSGPLAQAAVAVSASNSAWFATTTPLSEFMSSKQPGNLGAVAQSPMLQNIQQATGGVLFSSAGLTLSADAVTTSPQNAQALVDVLKFFVSMIGGNQNAPANVTSIANSAQFSVNGSTAHISVMLAEAQAEQLLMPGPGGAKRATRKPAANNR